ncbi:MAG: hypothetical protein ACK4YP_04780, partial [Myxococcota bacterium]
DGDGDVVIGAPYNDSASTSAGAAYVVYGGFSSTEYLSLADATFRGPSRDDFAGWSVAAGDYDGDGVGDLAVGGTGYSDEGTVWIAYGPLSGVSSSYTSRLVAEDNDDYVGFALRTADFDADGFDDLLVGAPGDDDGGTNAGALYLLWGGLGY